MRMYGCVNVRHEDYEILRAYIDERGMTFVGLMAQVAKIIRQGREVK